MTIPRFDDRERKAVVSIVPEGFAQVDTPDDHNCLFWSAVLGLLLPHIGDETAFYRMYDRLFDTGQLPVGEEKLRAIEAPDTKEWVLKILRTYDCQRDTPLEYEHGILKTLVCTIFRGRVVNKLSEVFPDAEARGPIVAVAQRDNPAISSWDKYTDAMRKSIAWGGAPEIQAISQLAEVNINVLSAGAAPIPYTFPGSLQILYLAHVNGKNKVNGNKNHYHYGLSQVVYEELVSKNAALTVAPSKSPLEALMYPEGEFFVYPQEHKNEKKAADISRFFTNKIFFAEGDLTSAMFDTVPRMTVLTAEEKDQIIRAKQALNDLIKAYQSLEKSRNELLHPKDKNRNIQMLLKRKSMAGKAESIKQQKKALEYFIYLSTEAQKLLKARQFKDALIEFKWILDHSEQMGLADHVEILKIKLDYALNQYTDYTKRPSPTFILEVIGQLKNQLSKQEKQGGPSSCVCKDIKRAIAMGYYRLAQHCLYKCDFNEAIKFIDESERLRKEYGASEEEFDRIRFIRAKISYETGSKEEALQKLEQCYKFRYQKGKFSSDLVPVLQQLIIMMEKDKNVPQQFLFLRQLLDIHKHLNFDDREILTTQLRLLNVMDLHASTGEYMTLLNEVEERLNKIPVPKESADIGMNYVLLAEARVKAHFPQEWSKIDQRKFHAETSRIIYKAKQHLMTADKDIMSDGMKQLEYLSNRCKVAIDLCNDLRQIFKGEKLHPKDKKELALSLAPGDSKDEKKSESSTKERLKSLSDYSSEVLHVLVDKVDRLITVEEFDLLPEQGIINPYKLRTAQGGINPQFRNGKSLAETKQALVTHPNSTQTIPPVEIGVYQGKVYSFDTRRLVVHQQAREENINVNIRYKKISGKYLQERIEAIFSSRPWNGIVTALRRGGKNSESEPYVNPALRPQLSTEVQKEFKRYPSDRKSADANGFPVTKKKAKKLYSFFEARAGKGSERAEAILQEARRIRNSKGKEAVYDYLIKKKDEIVSDENNSSKKGSLVAPANGDSKSEQKMDSATKGDEKKTCVSSEPKASLPSAAWSDSQPPDSRPILVAIPSSQGSSRNYNDSGLSMFAHRTVHLLPDDDRLENVTQFDI